MTGWGKNSGKFSPLQDPRAICSVSLQHSWRTDPQTHYQRIMMVGDMPESSSSSSSSGRFVHQGLVFDGNRRFHAAPQCVTKLTAAGKALARHFRDIPMRILAALVISTAVVGILAAVTIHHEDEVLPEVKNYIGQKMTDAKGFWAKVDISDFKDYIEGFFTNKKIYRLEVTPEGSSFLDLFKWKSKKFNVKIADL